MSDAVKAGQANTAQTTTEQASKEDLQSKIQEVNEQKTLKEQNLVSAKENTVNVVGRLNQEMQDFVVQKLTEQGNTEAVNVINSQSKKYKILT